MIWFYIIRFDLEGCGKWFYLDLIWFYLSLFDVWFERITTLSNITMCWSRLGVERRVLRPSLTVISLSANQTVSWKLTQNRSYLRFVSFLLFAKFRATCFHKRYFNTFWISNCDLIWFEICPSLLDVCQRICWGGMDAWAATADDLAITSWNRCITICELIPLYYDIL